MNRTGRCPARAPPARHRDLAACATQGSRNEAPPADTHARIGLLETTDIHTNILSYDYYKLAEDQNIGLERAATLIRAARKEFENSLTFDDGDTIQGTVLADYQALVSARALRPKNWASTRRWTRSATTPARSAITSSTMASSS